jgi:hypothetical protein
MDLRPLEIWGKLSHERGEGSVEQERGARNYHILGRMAGKFVEFF